MIAALGQNRYRLPEKINKPLYLAPPRTRQYQQGLFLIRPGAPPPGLHGRRANHAGVCCQPVADMNSRRPTKTLHASGSNGRRQSTRSTWPRIAGALPGRHAQTLGQT